MKSLTAVGLAIVLSRPVGAQDSEDLLDRKIDRLFESFARGRRSAPAQDPDAEKVKRIVDRIEREIRESHDRTREEIRAIIRAEIQKNSGKAAPPNEVPAEKPAAPHRVHLGITADDLTEAERKSLGSGGGIKIADVRGPAKDAGLKTGDILVELDGEPVTEERIGDLLSKHKAGDSVEATVVRSKKRVTVKVVLAERKD